MCVASGFLLFYPLSLSPVSTWLANILEGQYPTPVQSAIHQYDAIVVLSGGIMPAGGPRANHELTEATLRRTLCGASLIRQGAAPLLVLSGGNAHPFMTLPPESVEMKKLALRMGVPDTALVIESLSRNTYENAREVKKILGSRNHILLVTSAIHLPRAVRLYQKQGFRLTPVPCGYLGGQSSWAPLNLVPSAGAMVRSSKAINEILGIAVYWMAGKL